MLFSVYTAQHGDGPDVFVQKSMVVRIISNAVFRVTFFRCVNVTSAVFV